MADNEKEKKRNYKYFEKNSPAAFVSLGRFERTLISDKKHHLAYGQDVPIVYNPLPNTHPTVQSSCVFSLNGRSSGADSVVFTQYDKIVLDSLYTLYHNDLFREEMYEESGYDEGVAGLYTYSFQQIARGVTREDKRISAGMKKDVFESLMKVSGIDVLIQCNDEMTVRNSSEVFGERRPIIDCDFVPDKNGEIEFLRIKSAPELYRYARASKEYQLVGERWFRMPEDMKSTKQHLMLLTYLRDRILCMERGRLSTTILYDTLQHDGLAKDSLSRAEKKVVRDATLKILDHFTAEGILNEEKPFETPRVNRKIPAVTLFLKGRKKKEDEIDPDDEAKHYDPGAQIPGIERLDAQAFQDEVM